MDARPVFLDHTNDTEISAKENTHDSEVTGRNEHEINGHVATILEDNGVRQDGVESSETNMVVRREYKIIKPLCLYN